MPKLFTTHDPAAKVESFTILEKSESVATCSRNVDTVPAVFQLRVGEILTPVAPFAGWLSKGGDDTVAKLQAPDHALAPPAGLAVFRCQ